MTTEETTIIEGEKAFWIAIAAGAPHTVVMEGSKLVARLTHPCSVVMMPYGRVQVGIFTGTRTPAP